MTTDNKVLSFAQAKRLMAQRIREMDLAAKPPIFRIEIKLKPVDPIHWLEAQKSEVKVYGENQDRSASIAGIGEALRVQVGKVNHFSAVFRQLRSYLTAQYPYMQWYGGFCFDDTYLDKHWKDFSAYCFVLPRFELARDGNKMIFCCNLIGELLAGVREVVLKELDTIQTDFKPSSKSLKGFTRQDLPSRKQWDQNVHQVLNRIQSANLQKVVLARKTKLKFSKELNPFDVFRKLYKVTPNSYHFYFQFADTVFLGASPERLYKRQGRRILSEAVAGTSPRGKNSVQDKSFKRQLMTSVKDNHEHEFVVDAIKENLGFLCDQLQSKSKPAVMSLGNGHHLKTTFEGQLKEGAQDEDILEALHPTPAVAGSSKDNALATIRKLEDFSRGWYAGPVGFVGLDWSEFVVGIRSALIRGKEMAVYAGAGIVQGSDAESEWQEIENKIGNFIKIVS